MSNPIQPVRISILNKPIYDFLCKYASEGCFKKEKLHNFVGEDAPYPYVSLTEIDESKLENDTFAGYEIKIRDGYADPYHTPESIYDVLPCMLIYLAQNINWDHETFIRFRDEFLENMPDVVDEFESVIWESVYGEYRIYDGKDLWRSKRLEYNRATDIHHFTHTIENNIYDEEAAKYNDVDWDELEHSEAYAGEMMCGHIF